MAINRIDRGSGFGQRQPPTGHSSQQPERGPGRFDVGSEISDLAGLMNQLQRLQQGEPARFGQVLSRIADRLRAEARSATGPRSQFLGQLAEQFRLAGQSRTMPPLVPGGTAAESPHSLHGAQGYGAQPPGGAGGGPTDPLAELAGIIQESLREAGVR